MQSEKEPPASSPRPVLWSRPQNPTSWNLSSQSLQIQFRDGRRVETRFDSRGRPVERQTHQVIGPMPGPAQWLPENPYLRQ